MAKTESERADQRLAAAAMAKQAVDKRPTRDELAALRRVEARKAERLRQEHYTAVPKATWREWSGHLAHKTLDDYADRFGLPTRGRTVDLPSVVFWLYTFLREVGPGSAADSAADVKSEALEEMRRWEAKRRELRYRREAGELFELVELERLFSATAEIMRRAGETIRQEFGDRAAKIIIDAWDDVSAFIDRQYHPEDSDDEKSPEA